MSPILLSALFGLVKGFAAKRLGFALPEESHDTFVRSTLVGPILEELQFRLGPALAVGALGKKLPTGVTALPFALAHIDTKASLQANVYRVTDAGVGGLLYESAFRSHGLPGAVLAHALHNLLVDVGGEV